jgi:type I restriction enzyme M protein
MPDQLFYNTGIFTYIWILRNDKPANHCGRVMIIDARKQFEKEPKSFGNKRNRMTEAHHQWVKQRYDRGWRKDYADENVKIFRTADFAYHKVSVVFWQTDENDQPAIVTEPYEKAFTPANVAKEQGFHASNLSFRVTLTDPKTKRSVTFSIQLKPADSFTKIYENAVRKAFPEEVASLAKKHLDVGDRKKALKRFIDALEIGPIEWTHRHYVKDDEYISGGEDIEQFLKREIAKPITRWEDNPQLGYEILPNKYFYRYQPPTSAKALLDEFWSLEKEAEQLLQRLIQTP